MRIKTKQCLISINNLKLIKIMCLKIVIKVTVEQIQGFTFYSF